MSWLCHASPDKDCVVCRVKTAGETGTIKFTVECEMKERWVPYFLGMLKTMQYLGHVGSSRKVTIYADGDGDFHPKFEFDPELPVKEIKDEEADSYLYDAG